ncbi:MAG: phytanoyl-CoA hydroxylase [Candidatus Poriferisodalaceae bacterium]
MIGDDILLQHSKKAAQPPEADKGGRAWRQDFAFYPHTNTGLVAVMVMLDDATPDNGCMRMVRGSHKRGLLNHMDANGMFTNMCQAPSAWKDHVDDAFQMADGVWADTGLMVSGVRRKQVRCDAGVLRLPKSDRYPAHPFGHAWNQEGDLARELNGRAVSKG